MATVLRLCLTLAVLLAAGAAQTANTLPAEEADAGWVLLFDGQNVTRLQIAGEYQIQDGVLRIGGDEPAAVVLRGHFLDDFEIQFDYQLTGSSGASPNVHHVPSWGGNGEGFGWGLRCTEPASWGHAHYKVRFRGKTVSLIYGGDNDQVYRFSGVRGYVDFLRLDVPAGHTLSLRNVKLREKQAAWVGWWIVAVVATVLMTASGALMVYRRRKSKLALDGEPAGVR
jgi:hypothetical protein